MLDRVNASTRYVVRINDDPLNDTTLNEADILLLVEPSESEEFEQSEIDAISEMMANGSSLLMFGNPTISHNSTYWTDTDFQDMGNNIVLNKILDDLNVTGIRFSVNQTLTNETWCDTMFDYENALNETRPWVIHLDASTWITSHPIFRDINDIYTMTATLKPIGIPSQVATGDETTFAQYRRGPSTWANYSFPNMSLTQFEEMPFSYSAINGTFPPWLCAFEHNGTRIIIGGSALMFTGRALDIPESEEKWFYMGDNSRLFLNMLDWLSEREVEAPSAVFPMFIISSLILAVGIAYYIVRKFR
jgi:hypothetical protein